MILADLDRLLPGWMLEGPRRYVGQFLAGAAATLDAMIEGVQQARLGAMPGMRDVPGGNGFDINTTSLPFTGRDRNIRGGLAEEPWDWAARQRAWLDSWGRAATPWMMLEQLAGILSPNPPRLRIVTAGGVWWTRETDGTIKQHTPDVTGFTYDPATGTVGLQDDVSNLWNWDSYTLPACPGKGDADRFWVIVYAPCNLPYLADDDDTFADPGVVDDYASAPTTSGAGESPDAGTIGTTSPIEHVELVRRVVKEWRAMGCEASHIIVSFDPDAFDPIADTVPTSVPDGYWGWHTKLSAGVRIPARFPNAEYWPANPGGRR